MASIGKVRLENPIPEEALIQFQRHCEQINTQRGFNYNITKTSTTIVPESVNKSNISGLKNVMINFAWDLDTFVTLGANGYAEWTSNCFLNCYLHKTQRPNQARTWLFADLLKYFYDPGPEERWTLFTQNKVPVVRQLIFKRLNTDIAFDKSPIIKLDIEVELRWACLHNDLYQLV